MIRPAIAPTRVFNPISRGLFTAAKNSVNQVQESTQKISKGLNKDQKFAMNYVQFFGAKKTTKILRKNLKSLTKSLKTTFDIAKNMKNAVSKMAKGGGLLKGIVGSVGGAFLGGLFGKLAIATLAGIAVGGIGFLLYRNAGTFFQFLKDRINDFRPIVESILSNFLLNLTVRTGDIDAARESDQMISERADELMEDNPKLTRKQALNQAVNQQLQEIDDNIAKLKDDKRNASGSEKKDINAAIQNLNRQKNYIKTGTLKSRDNAFVQLLRNTLRTQVGMDVEGVSELGPDFLGYSELSQEGKLNKLLNILENNNLEDLKFNALRSANVNLARGGERERFNQDLLNIIAAKEKSQIEGTPLNFTEKDLLPATFPFLDLIPLQNESKKKFKNLFLKPLPEDKNVNVINGQNQSSTMSNNNGGEVSSTKADGGRSEIAFLSPQNFDSSMEKLSSCVMYGCYMDA